MSYSHTLANPPRTSTKPLLIRIAPPFILVFSLSSVLMLTTMLIAKATGRVGGGGAIIGEVSITEAEFIWRAAPFVFSVQIMLLTLAVGLYRGRLWARPLSLAHQFALVFLILVFLPPRVVFDVVLQQLPSAVLATALAYLYFYRKRTVVDYYANLSREAGR